MYAVATRVSNLGQTEFCFRESARPALEIACDGFTAFSKPLIDLIKPVFVPDNVVDEIKRQIHVVQLPKIALCGKIRRELGVDLLEAARAYAIAMEEINNKN